jgi:hypothetical protein
MTNPVNYVFSPLSPVEARRFTDVQVEQNDLCAWIGSSLTEPDSAQVYIWPPNQMGLLLGGKTILVNLGDVVFKDANGNVSRMDGVLFDSLYKPAD